MRPHTQAPQRMTEASAVGGAAWSGRRRASRNWAVLGLLVPLAAACGGENDPQGKQSVDPSPTASRSEAVGTVQTNSGGSVHYRCAGEGDPTILMEAGGGAGTDEFAALLDPLAEENRVCTYDRPGTGMSPDVPDHRRTLDDLCQVQDEVIEALAIAGPYVLLGQSFGGNIVIGCAERHPDRVAGLEVVEGYHDDPQQMRKWAREEGWTWQGNPEHVDGVDISDELRRAGHAGRFIPRAHPQCQRRRPGKCGEPAVLAGLVAHITPSRGRRRARPSLREPRGSRAGDAQPAPRVTARRRRGPMRMSPPWRRSLAHRGLWS